jgi:hypothetical protein
MASRYTTRKRQAEYDSRVNRHIGADVPPIDTKLLALLRGRDGPRTLVTLTDGRELTVFNIAWGVAAAEA